MFSAAQVDHMKTLSKVDREKRGRRALKDIGKPSCFCIKSICCCKIGKVDIYQDQPTGNSTHVILSYKRVSFFPAANQ